MKARYRSASGEWSALYDATFTQTSVGLRPGDFDRNGTRNAADLPAMFAALTDSPAYLAAHNPMSTADLLAIGDLDGDARFTNADVQAFISRLIQDAAAGGGAGSSRTAKSEEGVAAPLPTVSVNLPSADSAAGAILAVSLPATDTSRIDDRFGTTPSVSLSDWRQNSSSSFMPGGLAPSNILAAESPITVTRSLQHVAQAQTPAGGARDAPQGAQPLSARTRFVVQPFLCLRLRVCEKTIFATSR